jgi:regulator of nucleoside diphosphate kinase
MTTISLADYRLSPEIILGHHEHQTLQRLAMAHAETDSEELLGEIDRAVVVPDGFVPPDVVRMGAFVVFRTEEEERQVQLVYPKDANIAEGRISILTPIGTALIGLRAGQTITWRKRDGQRQALTVLKVLPPPPPDEDGPVSAA